jgi:hypothetical protein
MSEPLAERLSRFTPNAAGLDRDALLFAAGRASVRPNRHWKILAAVLAASQLLTLVSLWPHTPTSSPPAPSLMAPTDSSPLAASEPDPSGDAQTVDLYDRLLSRDLERPAPINSESLVPPEPPLRAFGTPPSTILN